MQAYADSLFARQLYTDAALAYERLFFVSEDPETKVIAKINRIQCLKQTGNFETAHTELQAVNMAQLSDTLHYRLLHELALCAYLSGHFNDADSYLKQMQFFIRDTVWVQQSLYLDVLVKNELEQLDLAYNSLEQLIESSSLSIEQKDSLSREALRLYSGEQLPQLKSEKTGEILAYLPGLAHCYAGYPGEGILSFLLNLGALSFGVHQIYYGYYFTGYFVGAGLLYKFNFGSRSRSEYLIKKHNYEEIRRFNNQVEQFIFRNGL